MEEHTPIKVEDLPSKKGPGLNRVLVTVIIAIAVLVVLSGTAVAVNETYHKDRIFNGISIGPLDIGGLKINDAQSVLETWHDSWWNNQLVYQVFDEVGKKITDIDFFPLITVEGSGSSYQFVSFDLEKMLNQAYEHGRDPSFIKRVINQINLLMTPKVFNAIVEIDNAQLREVLELELEKYETIPKNASIELASPSAESKVISEQSGNTFNYEQAISNTKVELINMTGAAVEINRKITEPVISAADALKASQDIGFISALFPVKLSYHDDRIGFDRIWTVRWSEVYHALAVQKYEDNAYLAIDNEQIENIWERVESIVNVESADAKFSIGEDGKVEQFQPSKKGYILQREESADLFNTWIREQSIEQDEDDEEEEAESGFAEATLDKDKNVILLAVEITNPKVPTSEVNDLGITEVLGVGYSNFSGSPANRVHNIGIGAGKLNGLLIEPDEEFSLLAALRPFTAAGGYLPELVIKGEKIVPEIGGGLCQIGSTTFRATMKSGLPVTERRNHSLVVSYYNDPRNGNPGTDATIYDSSPDFKFINDTGNYILIETDMNTSNGDLFFTFWGTSDGRKGEYTEPVVHRWIGAGETKYIETEDLEPGQQKCQGSHIGAVASFTYTITRSDGELEETLYKSSYRPLPTICLVGIDPDAPKEGEEGEQGEEEENILGEGDESSSIPEEMMEEEGVVEETI